MNRIGIIESSWIVNGWGQMMPVSSLDNVSSPGVTNTLGPMINLLAYSQAINIVGSGSGNWSNNSSNVITADAAIAPDGTMTAEKIVSDTSLNHHELHQYASLLDNTIYTYSVYIKSAGNNGVILLAIGKSGFPSVAQVNFSAGTITPIYGTPAVSIVLVGNGWYRCSLTFNSFSGAANPNVQIYLNAWAQSTGDGVNGIYAWGAQLEPGLTATDYNFTTATINTGRAVTSTSSVTSMAAFNGTPVGMLSFLPFSTT